MALFTHLIALLGLFSFAFATRNCGANPSDSFLAKAAELAAQEDSTPEVDRRERSTVTIKTYIHVIESTTLPSDWNVTKESLKAQRDLMNEAYSSVGFRFKFKAVKRYVNNFWSLPSYDEIAEDDQDNLRFLPMKQSLRRGDYGDLNIYYVNDIWNQSVAGFATFPSEVESSSDEFYQDGVVLGYDTLPTGNYVEADEGKSMIHEIGHWLGLFHTFQSTEDCTGDGDTISDTPMHSGPSDHCNEPLDTCPGEEGLDPVYNYMNYVDHECRTEFTPMQSRRMRDVWREYRA